jgi:hypothetical protein
MTLAATAACILGLLGCERSAPPPGSTSRLINTPALSKLTPDQLHGLAKRCERYTPEGPARGPYDAKYCEDALAAWADSPIQMLTLPKDAPR